MKLRLAYFLALLATGGLIANGAPPIKIMTYNIRLDVGPTPANNAETAWNSQQGPNRRDMVLRVIQQQAPDLLALQEALQHQVEAIATAHPELGLYSVGRDDGDQAGEQCSIFYRTQRFERLDAGTFWLSDTPAKPGSQHPSAACPRIASWVVLRDRQQPDRPFVMLNTHWDHVGQPARLFAANAIMEHLKDMAPGGAAIVTGDMNATCQTEEMRALFDDRSFKLLDAYRQLHPQVDALEATFNGFSHRTRGSRIDYVLHTADFQPQSAKIDRTRIEGKNPSDHFPVVVELQ